MTELFASVLRLNRRDVTALRITDLYSLHRVVYSLYPDIRNADEKLRSAPSGILFADLGGDAAARRILTLANRAPVPASLAGHGAMETKTVPEAFLGYGRYRFRVIVNPTKRDNKTRKLISSSGRGEIADWFVSRTQNNWGFAVVESELAIERTETHRFKDKAKRTAVITQALISGILLVNEPAKFRESFAVGIGRGRAFGCGLLQLQPIK